MGRKNAPKTPGPYRSKMNEYLPEIMSMHLQGKRAKEIHQWLLDEKKLSISYQNVHKFIRRNADTYQPPSGTAIICQIMRLPRQEQENIFSILAKLLDKKVSVRKSADVPAQVTPPPIIPKVQPVPEDFLTIRPDDSPGLKRLKRLASLDTTQLENLPPDLQPDPSPEKQ